MAMIMPLFSLLVALVGVTQLPSQVAAQVTLPSFPERPPHEGKFPTPIIHPVVIASLGQIEPALQEETKTEKYSAIIGILYAARRHVNNGPGTPRIFDFQLELAETPCTKDEFIAEGGHKITAVPQKYGGKKKKKYSKSKPKRKSRKHSKPKKTRKYLNEEVLPKCAVDDGEPPLPGEVTKPEPRPKPKFFICHATIAWFNEGRLTSKIESKHCERIHEDDSSKAKGIKITRPRDSDSLRQLKIGA